MSKKYFIAVDNDAFLGNYDTDVLIGCEYSSQDVAEKAAKMTAAQLLNDHGEDDYEVYVCEAVAVATFTRTAHIQSLRTEVLTKEAAKTVYQGAAKTAYRGGKRWTQEDLKKLYNLRRDQGWSYVRIARELGRSAPACANVYNQTRISYDGMIERY
jgi:hypothetical protein